MSCLHSYFDIWRQKTHPHTIFVNGFYYKSTTKHMVRRECWYNDCVSDTLRRFLFLNYILSEYIIQYVIFVKWLIGKITYGYIFINLFLFLNWIFYLFIICVYIYFWSVLNIKRIFNVPEIQLVLKFPSVGVTYFLYFEKKSFRNEKNPVELQQIQYFVDTCMTHTCIRKR